MLEGTHDWRAKRQVAGIQHFLAGVGAYDATSTSEVYGQVYFQLDMSYEQLGFWDEALRYLGAAQRPPKECENQAFLAIA